MRNRCGAALAVTALVAVAGCGQKAYERQIGVTFSPPAGQSRPDPAQVEAVRAACPGTASVVLLPPPTDRRLSVALTPVHYEAHGADDREVNEVIRCVQGRPGVASVGLTRQDY